MYSQVRILLLAVTVVVVAMIVGCMGQPNATARSPRQQKQSAGDCVARYATDEFVAACCVRPNELINHAYFGSLPIGPFLPHPLSLGRLDAMNVEELVVFCGPATDRKPADGQIADIQWAAVARTSHPIQLAAVRRQWRHSLVPQENDRDAEPVAVQIAGCECYQVPAGSFIMPPRTYGELHFTDRNGQVVEQGINIGRAYQNRGYIEGATKSSAIFTLDHLDEADLVDGHLPLELRPDVFPTHFLGHEYSIAQIELRNPDSGLRSEPTRFEAKSYGNHRLSFPRKVIAVDAKGERQVDLVEELVSNGRLEVVLQATESGVYLGVGKHDLNLRPRAFEYVFVSGREIVVAQSSRTLQKMLSAAAEPVSLANRLAQSTGDIVIAANVRDESQRLAFQRLMRTISDKPTAELLGDALTHMTATLSVNEPVAARVIAEFKDPRSAGIAMRQFNQVIRSAKAEAHASLGDSLNVQDCIGSLMSLGFDGVSMSFPDHSSPIAAARESQMLTIIDDSLDNVHVESDDNLLTVKLTQPACLSRLPEAAKVAMANIEEILARDLFAKERFDLGDEMYERVTDRFPHVAEAWFRRAHQLAYNMSVDFDGYQHRYAWVRRGVDVLLDGAERNPDTTDLTWMAARFIGWKIGDADEHPAYRQLFSQDERLHDRIAKIIDMERARSPDKNVDNWLVAKLLFEQCIARHAKSRAPSTIPPLLFFSRPAAAQARYAQALNESGHWNEALTAWKEAEQLYNDLGERTIFVGTDRIRLVDFESRLARFGPHDASVKQLQAARRRIQYEYWSTRCQLEQTANVQLARRLSREATEQVRRSELQMAYELYRQSLQALSEAHKQHPAQLALIAGEFQRLAAGYRKVAERLDKTDEPPLVSILTLIEQSQPVSRFPLLDLQNAHEGETTQF